MPGGKTFVSVYTIIAVLLLIAGVLFTIFGDFTMDYLLESIPLVLGVIISFTLEEILVARINPNMNTSIVAVILAVIGLMLSFLHAPLRTLWIAITVGCILVCIFNIHFVNKALEKAPAKKTRK